MQIEATGKSVEIAIQNGLLECGMKREEVNVKILEEGSLFKKAKVILTWGEDSVEEPKEDVKEELIEKTETIEEVNESIEETVEEEKVEKKKRIFDTTRIQEKGKEFFHGHETKTWHCHFSLLQSGFSYFGRAN